MSNVSLEDTKVQTTKRRGRGPFSYKKHDLFCDRQTDETFFDDVVDEDLCKTKEQNIEPIYCKSCIFHLFGFNFLPIKLLYV